MNVVTERRRGGRRGRTAPRPYASFDGRWQLKTGEMIWRVSLTPTRQKQRTPMPRKDLRENLALTYDWLWRRVRGTRNAHICTTRRQLANGVGLSMDRSDNSLRVTTNNWTTLLEEAGLIRVITGKDDLNMSARLEILLLEPPALPSDGTSPCSSTGRAADS